LAETAKAEVESALAEMGDEDLASEGWEEARSQRDAAAM
jgi:hypothetical protein